MPIKIIISLFMDGFLKMKAQIGVSRYAIAYCLYRLYPTFFYITICDISPTRSHYWRYFLRYRCCFTIEAASAEIKYHTDAASMIFKFNFSVFYMYFYMVLYMYIWYMVIYSDTIIHCRQRTQCYKSLRINRNWSP